MIIINKNYLDRFIKSRIEYLYPVAKGVYLAFDKKTLEYVGDELFYLAPISVDKEINKKLNELIAKGILEVI